MRKLESATPAPRSAGANRYLERGRAQYERRAWAEAYRLLSLAERSGAPLAGADLELRATAAYLTGRDDDYLDALARPGSAARPGRMLEEGLERLPWTRVALSDVPDGSRVLDALGLDGAVETVAPDQVCPAIPLGAGQILPGPKISAGRCLPWLMRRKIAWAARSSIGSSR